jgi:cyanate lyase
LSQSPFCAPITPVRGPFSHAGLQTDPCIYRCYEIVGVYGPTLKALIEEKFGTGIMSAIDFDMSVTLAPYEKGDRVKVEMSGKDLAYNAW